MAFVLSLFAEITVQRILEIQREQEKEIELF